MASGINFNRNAFAVTGMQTPQTRSTPQSEGFAPDPSESFQASPAQASSAAEPVVFKVTLEQLQAASFQATLQTLASSGIPANVVLVGSAAESSLNQNAKQPAPQAPPAPVSQPYVAPQPSYHPPTYGGD